MKISIIPVRFLFNQNFLDKILKNRQIPNFLKIRQVGSDLFHADRKKKVRHDEANSRCWRFCNAHKYQHFYGLSKPCSRIETSHNFQSQHYNKKANTLDSACETVSDMCSTQTILNNDAGNKTAITLQCIFQP